MALKLNRRRFIAGASLMPGILRAQLLQLPSYVQSGLPPNGLLAGTLGYWKMDESSGNAADATGNGWTGTNQNTTGFTAGLINNCANISAGNKGFSVSASLDTRAQTVPFAVSYWINNNGNGWTSGQGHLATIASGGIQGFLVYTFNNATNSAISFYSTTDAGVVSDIHDGGSNLIANAWNHVVVGYDGTNKLGYCNGVSVLTPTAVAGISHGHQIFAIGNYVGFTLGQLGLRDEIAYFNFMPSAAQVTTLYNGGNGLPFSSYS